MSIFSKKGKEGAACDRHITTVNAMKDKEVVSVTDGRRLGYICDMKLDLSSGKVIAVIVPGELKYFSLKRGAECVIPWHAICRIGDDVILVNPAEIAPGPNESCK